MTTIIRAVVVETAAREAATEIYQNESYVGDLRVPADPAGAVATVLPLLGRSQFIERSARPGVWGVVSVRANGLGQLTGSVARYDTRGEAEAEAARLLPAPVEWTGPALEADPDAIAARLTAACC